MALVVSIDLKIIQERKVKNGTWIIKSIETAIRVF
jgi:hypothetical protein